MFSRRVSTKLKATQREERLRRYMLSPTDIRSAVHEVLLNADRGLCAYEILESLPTDLRSRVITERGLPGAGNGKRYTAASLVTDSVEGLLPSLDPPYRVYVNASSLTYEVARSKVRPGNVMIAYYRMTNADVDAQLVPRHDSLTTPIVGETKPSPDPSHPTRVPWYEASINTIICCCFIAPPVGLYALYKNTKIAVGEKRTAFAVVCVWYALILVGVGDVLKRYNDPKAIKARQESRQKSAELQMQPKLQNNVPNTPAKEAVGVWITKDGFVSADTKVQLAAAAQVASQGDDQALQRLIIVGAVSPLKPGLRVRSVGHEGFPPTMVKIRVVGEQTEYWTFPEALKRGW